jgi:hypothetical protein
MDRDDRNALKDEQEMRNAYLKKTRRRGKVRVDDLGYRDFRR